MTPCTGMHELFDSTDQRDHQAARLYCMECPLLDACARLLEDVRASAGRYGQPEGTWAGELLIDKNLRYKRPASVQRNIARREFEERAWSEADARKAHAAYVCGDRSDWARMGHRVYDRRRKARQKGRVA